MFIQTNISTMQALRYNQMNNVRLNKVMEQLSSGLRIKMLLKLLENQPKFR